MGITCRLHSAVVVIGILLASGDFTAAQDSGELLENLLTCPIPGCTPRNCCGSEQPELCPETTDVAVPIECGQARGCSIDYNGDWDFYSFQGSAGQRVMVTATSSCAIYPYVEVRDSDNNTLAKSDTLTCNKHLEVDLPEDGSYLIALADVGLNNTGSYIVALNCP